MLPTETREPNEVIAIQKCQNEEYIAIISGKNLILSEQKPNQLFIYKRERKGNGQRDEFVKAHWVMVKDIDIFQQVCMNFHF